MHLPERTALAAPRDMGVRDLGVASPYAFIPRTAPAKVIKHPPLKDIRYAHVARSITVIFLDHGRMAGL